MNLQQLRSRYTVKRYDPDKKISQEKIDMLVNAFHLCPSSVNLQGWKLFVVGDQEVKEKLSPAGMQGNDQRIKDCSHLLVLARKKSINRAHFMRVIESTKIFQVLLEKRGMSSSKFSWLLLFVSKLSGGKKWVEKQLYIALGFLMAQCADLEVGSTAMEGVKMGYIDKVLGIGDEFCTVVTLAIGEPAESDFENPSKLDKSRFPKEEVTQII